MFYIRTFHPNGSYRLGSAATLVEKRIKTLPGVIRMVKGSGLDIALGYDIVQMPASNPYAKSKIVHRSARARELFGDPS